MKLTDFNVLCRRVSNDTLGHRGDVIELRLTNDSRRELCADALVQAANDWSAVRVGTFTPVPLEKIVCGAVITEIVNPVTGSTVKVIGGGDSDRAVISSDTVTEPEIITV